MGRQLPREQVRQGAFPVVLGDQGVQAALELALVPHLDVDPLVQGEPHQVQGLLHSADWRGFDIISHHKVFYKTVKL